MSGGNCPGGNCPGGNCPRTNSTMARIRNHWWIPKLRRLVKSLIHSCPGCKKYRSTPLQAPAQPNLPDFWTNQGKPFQVTGVDFAGPIIYQRKKKMQGKAYVALYACSTTRVVSLQLLPDLTAEEFQHSLKLFIAKRGTPEKQVSDNGKTFVATGKWIKKLKEPRVGKLPGQKWNSVAIQSQPCCMVGTVF